MSDIHLPLPCPFCGFTKVTNHIEITKEFITKGYYVECTSCQIRTGYCISSEDACCTWNRRSKIEEHATNNKFISVKEKKPKNCDDIIFISDKKMYVGFYGKTAHGIEHWIALCAHETARGITNVTHWMPLPEMPKEVSDE